MITASNRLRTALLADDFNPEWPSLPIVAYKYACALADVADVTVFTHVRNRANLAKVGPLKFKVHFIDNEYIARPAHNTARWLRRGQEFGWTIEMASRYLPYLEFERLALKAIRRSGERYDVVHRVTPMSPTLPSYAAGRCDVPFVIGPLNGNLPWPSQFMEEQRREREGLSRFKNVYKFLPFQKSTFKNAAAILASFDHTVGSIDLHNQARTINVPEIGYDETIFYPPPKSRSQDDRLSFLYAGRLVPYKLPEIAILAFARKPELRAHQLIIAGDGPDEPRLRSLVAEHGLSDCVTFLGRLSQAQIAEEMRASNIFVFPSIRELGAGVVIEAMACGLPCLVTDYGAPGELVDESRGRKVPVRHKADMIGDFANMAQEMAQSRQALDAMSVAAASYAEQHFTWARKAEFTLRIYRWTLEHGDKPQFSF